MTKDLTKGNIYICLLKFTIPIILGNLFQLTYNFADSIIIGRFAGDDALASVGIADPVMNFLILGISGMCIGASVLMSNSYGAGKYEEITKEMETILAIGALLACVVTVVGFILSGNILRLLKTPDEIFADSLIYLRIIFLGMPFTCIYNIYSAALRSIGDSKTPIYFLILASIVNIVLDIIFICFLGLGTLGASLATVIAESMSAVLCVIYTNKHVPYLKVSGLRLHEDKTSLIIKLGSTTALQQCSQPIGKLFIQGMVNTLGVNTIAAFNAVGKIEDFALVPERSIGNSMMTFTAQNMGAKNHKRVREGISKGLKLEVLYYIFICIFIYFLHPYLLMLFSKKELTLKEGSAYFAVMSFFYILPGLTNGLQGVFRGFKHMKITLLGTFTQISLRVVATFFLIGRCGITGIAYACFIGWVGMLMLLVPLLLRVLRKEC